MSFYSQPKKFRLVFKNDDYTSYDHVINCLVDIVGISEDDAERIAHKIHKEGTAIVLEADHDKLKDIKYNIDKLSEKNSMPLDIHIAYGL